MNLIFREGSKAKAVVRKELAVTHIIWAFGDFVAWIHALSVFWCYYQVALALFRSIMAREWPCLMLIFWEIVLYSTGERQGPANSTRSDVWMSGAAFLPQYGFISRKKTKFWAVISKIERGHVCAHWAVCLLGRFSKSSEGLVLATLTSSYRLPSFLIQW